jgi:hypothetical protein
VPLGDGGTRLPLVALGPLRGARCTRSRR